VGTEVSKNLVLSGFKNIMLIDMDRVEISNLNRCIFFSESDARNKRFKAEVISKKLKNLNENINVNFHNKKIQDMPDEFIPSFDLVLGCLDNIEARLHLNAFCYNNEIPYVDSATNGFSGKVQVVLAPETPCLECNVNRSHMKNIELRRSCTGSDVTFFENPYPAEITTTSVIAAVQVREGLKIISKKDDILTNSIFYYNGEKNQSEKIEIDKNPSCSHHS
jgi:molybdopterin/thiamine biosynthesis adenylyltransferase